jgi:hypothetical protein
MDADGLGRGTKLGGGVFLAFVGDFARDLSGGGGLASAVAARTGWAISRGGAQQSGATRTLSK